MRFLLALLFLLLSAWVYSAEKQFSESKKTKPNPAIRKKNEDVILHVRKASGSIKLDGLISEPDWQVAEKASNFRLVLPVDSGLAKSQSEVVMTYDDKAFYLGVTFFDTIPGKRIMESFRRDFVFGNNDNFLAFFDTFFRSDEWFFIWSFGLRS